MLLRWSSQPATGAAHRRVFNLDATLIDDERIALTAWVDHADVRHVVLNRLVFPAVVAVDELMLNIDVFDSDGHGRIAAFSVLKDSRMTRSDRPLYARSILLERAGFKAGSHDPPSVEFLAPVP